MFALGIAMIVVGVVGLLVLIGIMLVQYVQVCDALEVALTQLSEELDNE